VLYGEEKIGKSTWASHAPNALFLPTEEGLGNIDCASVPLLKSWEDFYAALAALKFETHDFQSVVIDSADWLERLIWARVCDDAKVDSITKIGGGYGKGEAIALKFWGVVVSLLDDLRDKGIITIFICHPKAEKVENPETPAYREWSLKLLKSAAALLTEWADCVFFATRKMRIATSEEGFGKTRSTAHAIGDERIIRTVGSPACRAGNRYGLPAEMPSPWPQ
jgi:hypothetical protein